MSSALDPRAHRQARVRALAATIVDNGPTAPRFRRVGESLVPSDRRRFHGQRQVHQGPRYFDARRAVAFAALAVQVIALALALWLPAFRISEIKVSGAALLSRAEIVSVANIDGHSIFTVDGDTVRARLLAMPWIRTATVSTQLPNAVRIAITEWSPTLRMVHSGADTLLADDGAVVDASVATPKALSTIPVLIDARAGAAQTPPAALVQILDASASRFPAVFGTGVAAFQWQSDGLFAVWAKSGWRAILGHVDTADQIAAIPAQLSYLAALKGTLNFASPNFGYVDMENVTAPAVGGAPGIPASITAALALSVVSAPVAPAPAAPPSAAAAPAPSAAATPRPTPTPPPTPTPYVFYVPAPPSPSGH